MEDLEKETFASWIPNVSSDKWIVHVADYSNSDIMMLKIIIKNKKQTLEAAGSFSGTLFQQPSKYLVNT